MRTRSFDAEYGLALAKSYYKLLSPQRSVKAPKRHSLSIPRRLSSSSVVLKDGHPIPLPLPLSLSFSPAFSLHITELGEKQSNSQSKLSLLRYVDLIYSNRAFLPDTINCLWIFRSSPRRETKADPWKPAA